MLLDSEREMGKDQVFWCRMLHGRTADAVQGAVVCAIRCPAGQTESNDEGGCPEGKLFS